MGKTGVERIRHKNICKGWALERVRKNSNSYILLTPDGTDPDRIKQVLKQLPGWCGRWIMNDDFEVREFYFVSDLDFNTLFKTLIERLGLTYTPVPKEKKGRYRRAVLQYDLDGNFIAEYASGLEASEATGISICAISNCCNGKIRKPWKYIWRFKPKLGT